MANPHDDLTVQWLIQRFEEASRTARFLPQLERSGYGRTWPAIIHQSWETLGRPEPSSYTPPSPQAVQRMLETMTWVQSVEVDERKLIWARAQREPWRDVCAQLGCDRTTAWRRWNRALEAVLTHVVGQQRPTSTQKG